MQIFSMKKFNNGNLIITDEQKDQNSEPNMDLIRSHPILNKDNKKWGYSDEINLERKLNSTIFYSKVPDFKIQLLNSGQVIFLMIELLITVMFLYLVFCYYNLF
jgi:hypothetical protein